jgi:hypothetical protein
VVGLSHCDFRTGWALLAGRRGPFDWRLPTLVWTTLLELD